MRARRPICAAGADLTVRATESSHRDAGRIGRRAHELARSVGGENEGADATMAGWGGKWRTGRLTQSCTTCWGMARDKYGSGLKKATQDLTRYGAKNQGKGTCRCDRLKIDASHIGNQNVLCQIHAWISMTQPRARMRACTKSILFVE